MSVFYLCFIWLGQLPQDQSPIGIWEGTDSFDVKATLELKQDGSASMKLGTDHLFSSSVDGPSPQLLFNLDTSKSPAHFDLIAIDTSGKEIRRAKFLLIWVSNNQITLVMSHDLEVRSKSSDPKGDMRQLQLYRK